MLSLEEDLLLTLGMDIDYKGIKIKQHLIEDIVKMGIANYYSNCFPFIISMEALGVEIEGINTFDLFWLLAQEEVEGRKMLLTLTDGLLFFLDIDINTSIADFEKHEIKLNENVILTRDNFEELAEKIRAVTKTTKMKKNKKKVAPSKVVNSYLKARDKYIEKNKKENEGLIKPIKDSIMFLIHCSDTIDYKTVLKLTMCQLMNSAEMYRKKESFKINIQAHYAGQKISKKDLEHWSS